MKLKTFTAGSMPQALALVKSEYGAEAVILHTRTYKRGGVLGLGAQQVVEVTAGHARDVGAARRRQARSAPRPAPPGSARAPQPPAAPTDPPAGPAAGDLIKHTYAAARAQIQREESQQRAAALDPASDQVATELRAVKQLVGRVMAGQRRALDRPGALDVPGKLFDRYLSLLEQEVAEDLAEHVLDRVRTAMDPTKLGDDAACKTAVSAALVDLLPTGAGGLAVQPTGDGRPRTIALVGPTGVGKTTTIAKLAATFKIKQDRKVGLITADTYRIAAVDQLRTYAQIIGVPLQIASAPAQVERAVAACGDCDVILLDTAGRAPRNDQRLDDLAALLGAVNPHEVHLVLASTCTQPVMLDAVERFSRIRTDGIIFTKLDEAVTFGVLINVASKVKKRLCYFTTGQEVPHQIEVGRPERLAALVMGEAVNRDVIADQADALRELVAAQGAGGASRAPAPDLPARRARWVAVTSGKGGVGKTTMAVNLSVQLARMGLRVILLDADLGTANADVLCNVSPGRNLAHVVAGHMPIEEAMVRGPGGFHLIPGASGLAHIAALHDTQRRHLLDQLGRLESTADVILIDTGAGVSPNVLGFCLCVDEILLVTTPEPTAITDAYALIKSVAAQTRMREGAEGLPRVRVLVNMVRDASEGESVYARIVSVCGRFLDIRPQSAGHVCEDVSVAASIRRRAPFIIESPKCPAAMSIVQLADRIDPRPVAPRVDGLLSRMGRWLVG